VKIGAVDPEFVLHKSLFLKKKKKLMQAEHVAAGQACREG